jgi:hypothetical protein
VRRDVQPERMKEGTRYKQRQNRNDERQNKPARFLFLIQESGSKHTGNYKGK